MPSHTRSQRDFQHELISASAGSGKTWQLTRRYLHLLALGVEPQRIVAMTFTRKAAGEFFNRILSKLARLATREDDAAAYFKGLQPTVPSDVDYAALLRRLTRQIPRLRLGTLDSFFTAIATCFPMETGLSASAAIMDEIEAAQARMETLNALLDRMQDAGSAEGRVKLLLDAIKQASFSIEPKSLEDMMRKWVADAHQLWIESMDKTAWGNAARVWPDEDWSAEIQPANLQKLAVELRDLFPKTTTSGEKELEDLIHELPNTTPGVKAPRAVEKFLERSAEHWDDLCEGDADVKWGRSSVQITGKAASVWITIARGLCQREFLVRAQRARGLAGFLEAYESLYDLRVRAQGRLSFADIPLLLGAAAEHEEWPGNEVWFRLDGRYDHWMLDEFQDTSHSQWRVTERMVDEVLQDSDGRRSFFAVGDVKQSIYIWRQAEPEIFAGLRHRPNIQKGSLAVSYRSAPQVLAAVNQVFGDRDAINILLPGATENWLFEPHRCADHPPQGHAALLQMSKNDGDENSVDDDSGAAGFLPATRAAAALLHRLDPLARGLSCAVITRSNDKAIQLATELRTLTGMSVVTESKSEPTKDNAPVLALLSLLQLAAHPDDSAAETHLLMSPLRPLVRTEKQCAVTTALRAAEAVFEHGFTAFALEWSERLRALLPALDAFHLRRLAAFADLCATFDETGSRDLDEFLLTAREHTLSRPTGADAIQVMTVHKSKGLEFDIVIVAEMGKDAMNQVRVTDWLAHREDGRTDWVLQNPLTVYQEADPVLGALRREAKANAAFESLCVLYVAMTRAKSALYLLTPPPPKNGKSVNPAAFLRDRLGSDAVNELEVNGLTLQVLWQDGDPAWFEMHPPLSTPAEPVAPAPTAVLRDIVRQNQPSQRRRTPSGEEDFHVPGTVLFSVGRDFGRRLGSRVHELLAEVEWWTAGDSADPLLKRWHERRLLSDQDEVSRQALNLVLSALNDPVLAFAFAKPASDSSVWREKSFDLIDDGGWVSGVFDRVLLDLDDAGIVTGARLIDFKTDDIPDAEALDEKSRGYKPQLALYRRAVARLTGLPLERVTCFLLFLRCRQFTAV